MRKRLGIIILSALLVSGLAACGNNTINDNSKQKETNKVESKKDSNSIATSVLKQGKESLQKEEYSKALASFDIVLENDSENKEAAILKKITNDYIASKKYLDQWEIDKAQNRIEVIDSQYKEYPIKDAVDNLKKQIEDAITTNEKINSDIKKLTVLYNDKKYEEAKNIISELNSKKLDQMQKERINNINEELKKIEEIKKAEELKKAEEIKNKKAAKENPIKYFTEKLNNIEIGIKKDLSEDYASGVTAVMRNAANEEYKRWDKVLNEIYGVLKTQLSDSDMSKLQEEQIKWISDKENKAKEDSLEFEGGTLESLTYISSLAETTKARCYELVEKYIKSNSMQEDVKESTKEVYINKLNEIETALKKDLADWYKGPQSAITAAAGEEYKRWDDALNEIYNFLKTHLSDRDMSKLQEEQIQWISDKEKNAKKELEVGGSMSAYYCNKVYADTTKARCYELVEKYIK